MIIIPPVTYLLVLPSTLILIGTILYGLHITLLRAGWGYSERLSVMKTTATALSVWFLAAALLSFVGAYQAAPNRMPTIELGLATPLILLLAMFAYSAKARHVVENIPQQWLIGIQTFRVIGVVFVILYAQASLPAQFALPAGLGDIAIGLLAPIVAALWAYGTTNRETWVRVWNLLGIFDLIIAVGTGFLTSPSPLQMIAFDNPNLLISTFPLAMIPLFAVPIAIALHVISLIKLKQAVPAVA